MVVSEIQELRNSKVTRKRGESYQENVTGVWWDGGSDSGRSISFRQFSVKLTISVTFQNRCEDFPEFWQAHTRVQRGSLPEGLSSWNRYLHQLVLTFFGLRWDILQQQKFVQVVDIRKKWKTYSTVNDSIATTSEVLIFSFLWRFDL